MPEDQTLAEGILKSAATLDRWVTVQAVLDDIATEREAQYEQWGDQPLPLGFGSRIYRVWADQYRKECDEADERGELTHRHILLEEFSEALAEGDPQKARDELIQLAACAVKAIEQIDRRIPRDVPAP